MTDSASPVNSQWAAIIADAAQSPNKDILIETTDPLFDGQVCKATFAAPDPSDIRDGRGLQVRLSATISETITSVDGVQKTAGWVWRGRPTHVEAASNEERARQQAEIGCRSLAGALVAAKLLRKGEQPTLTQLVTLLPQLEGKEVVLRFFLKAGKTRDDNGDLKQFQEVRFAPAGTANAADAPATSDY
jgi:hypothetical protein